MESKFKIGIFSVSLLCLLYVLTLWSKTGKLLASPDVYRGVAAYGFEGRVFAPCNIDNEVWWIKEVDDDFVKEMHFALTGDHYKPVYMVAKMLVSAKGSHGHMGMSDRVIEVLEVREMSLEIPNECKKLIR